MELESGQFEQYESVKGFTETYTERALLAVSQIIKKAYIRVDGVYYLYNIAKTVIRDGFYKLYFEVDSDPVGRIDKVVAVDDVGVPLWGDNFDINKDDEGWHLAIKAQLIHVDQTKEGSIL